MIIKLGNSEYELQEKGKPYNRGDEVIVVQLFRSTADNNTGHKDWQFVTTLNVPICNDCETWEIGKCTMLS